MKGKKKKTKIRTKIRTKAKRKKKIKRKNKKKNEGVAAKPRRQGDGKEEGKERSRKKKKHKGKRRNVGSSPGLRSAPVVAKPTSTGRRATRQPCRLHPRATLRFAFDLRVGSGSRTEEVEGVEKVVG